MFSEATISMPNIHAAWLAWKAGPRLEQFHLHPHPEWHGRSCAVLGYASTYAAIAFPEDGKRDYHLIRPEYVK